YLPEEQEDAESTAEWVRAAGRTAVLCPGDLTDETLCRQLVEAAVDQLGGVELLVNNAGHQWGRDHTLEALRTERLNRTLKTNLYAMFCVCRAALPHLDKGASIINVSSIQAYEHSPTRLDYAATKA